MASSVNRRIEGYLPRVMGQRDPAGLIRPRSTEPIRACGRAPRHQAGHMTAIGLRCRHVKKSLRAGGHPHKTRGAEVMVAYLKLLIAKMKRERFGQSAERGRKLLDQLELQLEELEASATEDEIAVGTAEPDPTTVLGFTRQRPVRGPLPAHLPRERVVVPAP